LIYCKLTTYYGNEQIGLNRVFDLAKVMASLTVTLDQGSNPFWSLCGIRAVWMLWLVKDVEATKANRWT
jgi:hypothetical protein